MTSLHIREFQEEDTAAVVALWQACGLDVIQFYEAIGYTQDKVVSFSKRLIPDNRTLKTEH